MASKPVPLSEQAKHWSKKKRRRRQPHEEFQIKGRVKRRLPPEREEKPWRGER